MRFFWRSEIHVDPKPDCREALGGEEPDRHFGAVRKRPRDSITGAYAQRSQSRRGLVDATVQFCEGPLAFVVDQGDPLGKVFEGSIKERGESSRPDRVWGRSGALDETSRLVDFDLSFDLHEGSVLGADLLLKSLDKAPKGTFAHRPELRVEFVFDGLSRFADGVQCQDRGLGSSR